MSSLLAEVRDTYRLSRAWQELRFEPMVGTSVSRFFSLMMNATQNPFGFSHRFAIYFLPRAFLVCLLLGLAVWGLGALLEGTGWPLQSLLFLDGMPAAWLGLHAGWWAFVVLATFPLLGEAVGNGQRGLYPTSFEVLRMPSRRGWLIVCWLCALPALIGLGCLFAGSVGLFRNPPPSVTLAGALALLATLPLLIGLLVALCSASGISAAVVVVAPFPLFVGGIGLSSQGGWAWPAFGGAVVLSVLLFAALVWAIDRREPWSLMRSSDDPIASLLKPVPVVPSAPVAGAPVGPLPGMRDRHGLFWTALYADLRKVGDNWFMALVLHLGALYFLVLALMPGLGWELIDESAFESPEFKRHFLRIGPSGLFTLLAAVLIAWLHPLRFSLQEKQLPQAERWLFHLGLDAVAWFRFRWRTWWLSPLLFVGVLLVLILGPTPDRLGVLAFIAGMLLIRAGWIEHPFRFQRRRLTLLCLSLLFVGTCYLLGPGLDGLFFLFGSIALGLTVMGTLLGLTAGMAATWAGKARTLGVSMLVVVAGFAQAYAVYRLVVLVPLWPSWTWAGAGILLLVGLVAAIEQWLTCDEETLQEKLFVWGGLALER